MDASTTGKQTKIEQCRKNAQIKSEKKRQAALQAIADLQQERRIVSRTTVARRAGVSVVFLRSHPDLLQAISEAGQQSQIISSEQFPGKANDQVIASLRRRLDEQKRALAVKESELRHKQREIDYLYGKLATQSPLTDEELRKQLQQALARLARDEQPK